MTAGSGNSCENNGAKERKNSRETIHSGHFMVSDFEAEAQDDEGIEVPEPSEANEMVEEIKGVRSINQGGVITYAKPTKDTFGDGTTVSIDGSLTKLFQTMSLAYRQNITSPKWNRFKGLRLRWKDKIRLNNVIWRCWHMQYMQKKNMTICQFALDVDIHNRPEAVVLEGKYWKRRLRAVTAEYKKWRLFYKNSLTGVPPMLDQGDNFNGKRHRSTSACKAFLGLEEMDWAGSFFNKPGLSPEEDSLLDSLDFTDMLFSPFSNGPLFPFPNPREIARTTGNSDLLQPGLVQLQPDLMDYDMMDIHEMLAGRGLPTVPEEDFFPEVEETAGLPPSSSPPSVSTPTPTTHLELNSRQTAIHPFDEPPSPQLYSHQDTFIPSRSQHPNNNTNTNPVLTTLQLRQEHRQERSPEKEGFARTTSPQISLESPDERAPERRDSPPSLHSSSSSESFVVPKNVPKKKYYGSGTSNWSSVPPGQTNMLGSNALVFPANSFSNQELHGHPDKNRAPVSPVGQISAPLPLTNVVHVPVETDPSAPSESNFLSHILSTDSCAPSVPHSPQSHTTKIKVARITPRPYPEIATSSSSLSKSNSKAILRPTAAGSSALSVASSNPQTQLLPNVTLSAVTPSSIKSIPPSVVSAQTSNWPSRNIKTSPPYPEPNSPSATHSISSSPPTKPFRPKSDAERVQYKEHRRVCHINAEQKRRCNIKNNFEMLHSLIPSVNQNPNAKVSKATMLHKGAEYILQMKQERQQLADQAEQLRNQIETLSTEISLAQSMLPATGAGMRPTRHNKIKEKFDSYIREQTLANPKYYVLALIAQPLLQSFNSSVSTASVDDLCRSSMAWLDQHCSLNVLRPVVSNAMRKLSVTTNILTTPETLYEDIFKQVAKQESGVKFNSPAFSPTEQR